MWVFFHRLYVFLGLPLGILTPAEHYRISINRYVRIKFFSIFPMFRYQLNPRWLFVPVGVLGYSHSGHLIATKQFHRFRPTIGTCGSESASIRKIRWPVDRTRVVSHSFFFFSCSFIIIIFFCNAFYYVTIAERT